VVKEVGKKPKFSARGGSLPAGRRGALGGNFKPRDYLEISQKLDLIDIKRAAKISGTRFGFLKNEAVLLEFALINFAFEILMKKGFIPIIPPVMVRREIMEGMGHLSEEKPSRKVFY